MRVQAHHANHTANTLAVRFVGSKVRMEAFALRALVPLGGFEYSRRLTLPPMGFCEDDSENSVEQRKRTISQQTAGLK